MALLSYCFGYLPYPPFSAYQALLDKINCSSCLKCPPHPADVPEQFVEAITYDNMKSILKELTDSIRFGSRGGIIYD